MIAIIDMNMSNIGSVSNMLSYIGQDCLVTSNPTDLYNASKLILPGVGNFDAAINNLKSMNLIAPILDNVNNFKKPILGICLGMQLLTKSSEEGNRNGLGVINAETLSFDKRIPEIYKVPHMGWNRIFSKNKTILDCNLGNNAEFYFAHSYYVELRDNSVQKITSEYGIEFVSGFQMNNIFGVQFHPEKSHRYGMKILSNFSNFNGVI